VIDSVELRVEDELDDVEVGGGPVATVVVRSITLMVVFPELPALSVSPP